MNKTLYELVTRLCIAEEALDKIREGFYSTVNDAQSIAKNALKEEREYSLTDEEYADILENEEI